MTETIKNDGDCLAAAAQIAEAFASRNVSFPPEAVVLLLEKSYQKLKELSDASKNNED